MPAADPQTEAEADELRRVYAALAAGRITEAEAQAAEEAVHARRSTPRPEVPKTSAPPVLSRRRRREKMFGGRCRPLDRNAKARIMHRAHALTHRTEKGRAYGAITAKALAVFEALLWTFHNARDGRCFPGYEKIAEAAHCARSTVYEAIHALETAGLLTWVNRIKRVREAIPGLPGVGATRVRVIRTSNAYVFAEISSKSVFPTGTRNQDQFPLPVGAAAGPTGGQKGLFGEANPSGPRTTAYASP